MEQYFRPKQIVVGPFFCFKICRIKPTVQSIQLHTSFDVKTGSPDSADFATTRNLIHQLWHFAQRLGRPLAYRGRHSGICQGALHEMPQPANLGGFF
jgi:hypothetical protein